MTNDLDARLYANSPIFDVPGGIALGLQLVAAAPSNANAAVQSALSRLGDRLDRLREAHQVRAAISTPLSAKPIKIMVEVAWSALFHRVEAAATLPEDRYPFVSESNGLLATLFPNGIAFTELDSPVEYVECDMRLAQIKKDKLAPAIERVAGKGFLDEVQRTHVLYGEVLGMSKPVDRPVIVDLTEPRRELAVAIGNYSLQVIAQYKLGGSEAELQMLMLALSPIDAHRARHSRAAAPSAEEGETETETETETPPGNPGTVPAANPPSVSAKPAENPAPPPVENTTKSA